MVSGREDDSGLNARQSAWETVQLARHPARPHALDYINHFDGFDELHGDRMYGDCRAVVGGMATFEGVSVMVLGQEKGHDLETRIEHNFGMPLPEGYRKAGRLFRLAERYQMPLIIFLDSPGAFAGVEAEKRNQSEAIASNIVQMTGLKVPIIVYVIGEAMSGGAMAMGVSDYTAMLANSVYSVISPEGALGFSGKINCICKRPANKWLSRHRLCCIMVSLMPLFLNPRVGRMLIKRRQFKPFFLIYQCV